MSASDFDNIPSVRLRHLADEYRSIKSKIALLSLEAEKIHKRVVRILGIGTYESVTVYEVGRTTVREHTRKGYKAIRARLR